MAGRGGEMARQDDTRLNISPPPSMMEVDDAQRNGSEDSDIIIPYASKSLTSSVLEYEFENGRRYHAYMAGSYPFPNDERELDRIDLRHHVMLLLCNGYLHLAPLTSPKRVLDLGTGTGIWAIEMSEQYPDSEVYGIDLSPVQPAMVPNNVHFEIDDVEARDWTWPDNHFDYIHSRFMIGSVSSWKRYIRKAYQHTKPGGYFELQELNSRFVSDDGSVKPDSALAQWSELMTSAAVTYNRPVPLQTDYYAWFVAAGFTDIKQVFLKAPTNPWPKDKMLKEAGRYQLSSMVDGIEGISMGLLTRVKGWKPDEVSVLMAKMRPEMKDRSIHSYQHHVVIVGRKPETTGTPAPRTPDSLEDGRSYGWGAPGSSTTSTRS